LTSSPDLRAADLPPKLVAHAREFFASGAEPVTPKLAATVLLLRGDDDGYQVHAIRRVPTMPFAPGMYAFPGGTVDPRDADADLRWSGPAPAEWADRLGQPERAAQAIVCAAVREIFEEAGVLLAGPSSDDVIGDVSGDDWEEQRAALVERRLGFADFLNARNLVLRGDLLAPWSRWITPEFEPRRYDTYFFLARLPGGQRTRNVGGEADLTTWIRPSDCADLPMLPPTRITLAQVDGFGTMDELIASASHRDACTPVTPRLVD
jgi:8-oxo-dGTP pyrophosphatase MutT (NUDIX family)